MIDMDFKKWYLSEAGTFTSSIATFAMPVFGGAVGREWPPMIAFSSDEEPKKKKKKKKKKK